MAGLDFTPAVREEELDEDFVEFGFTGGPYKCYRPEPGALASMATRMRAGTDMDKGAAPLAMLKTILDDRGYEAIVLALEDRKTDFGLEELMDLIAALTEAWADVPLDDTSTSAPPPKPTGSRSTGRARGKGSTPSRSPRTASTTSSTRG